MRKRAEKATAVNNNIPTSGRHKAGVIVPLTKLPLERVGTTGSRVGPVSALQVASTITLLDEMWPFKEFHHGVCKGWDEWIHKAVRQMFGPYYKGSGPQIHGWPGPLNNRYMSSVLNDVDVCHEPRPFKARDREISYHTQGLISGPKEWGEILRSGTWYTMRQAAAMLRPIWFVRSDGEVITDWKSEMNERVKGIETEELAQHPFDLNDVSLNLYHRMKRQVEEANDLDDAFSPDPHGDLDEAFG